MSKTSNELRVSIVLATYNGEAYLEKQIDSLLAQTYQPFEIIVSDDCSLDATRQIITHYREIASIPFRVIFNEVNLGFIQNFAQAIKFSKGDIIALCDQDDFWFPTKLEKIISQFAKTPHLDLLFSDALVADENLNPYNYTLYSRHFVPDLSSNNIVEDLIRKTDINGCTMAFRATLKPYILPISSMKWGHDHWIVFIAAVLGQIGFIDEPLMFYRRHTFNTGNTPLLDNRFWRIPKQIKSNLGIAAYEKDYVRWQDMLGHLKSLEPVVPPKKERLLARGINLCEARLEFARARLKQRHYFFVRRIPSIQQIYRQGLYHRYARGLRTAVKDFIA